MSSPLVLLVLGQAYFINPSFNNSQIGLTLNVIPESINHETWMQREADRYEYTSTSGKGVDDIQTAVANLLMSVANSIKPATTEKEVDMSNQQLTPQITTSTSTPSTTSVDPGTDSPLSTSQYKVVCHFTTWKSNFLLRYLLENIDSTLCTHMLFGYAILDETDLVIKLNPSWKKLDPYFHRRISAYQGLGVKVLLAVGGWNDTPGNKYSRLVESSVSRSKFVSHALILIAEYGFDGLEVDWEWPVCWQGDCGAGPATDREGFSLLLKELSAAFKPRGLLLTTKVGQLAHYIDNGYDLPLLAEYVDWITAVTYDYYGPWTGKTIHGAPLYDVWDTKWSVDSTISYLISKGAPSEKIVLGLPIYGRTFTINDPETGVGLNAPASAGEPGKFTGTAGSLAYYEICDRIHNHGWTVVQDPLRRMGPYAYKGDQWVSFDDEDMMRRKAQYVRDLNLGGGMLKSLDYDDFKGECGKGAYPLINAFQQVLAHPSD